MSISTLLEEGLVRYRDHKVETGSFLRACLENDLLRACEKADDFNRYKLFEIMCWIVNELPSQSYGSPEAVKKWLEKT